MGYVKTADEIAGIYRETFDFYDAEMVTVVWETKPEIVKRLLPSPLKPGKRPIALAFVANYPRTNFGVSYLESALFLRANSTGKRETTAWPCRLPMTWPWCWDGKYSGIRRRWRISSSAARGRKSTG